MSTIVLVRPGCTDFDEQCRIQGSLDLPLNRRGEDEVEEITESLREQPVEVVYTSSAEPARSTASRIADRLGIPIKEKDGLNNLDHGLWQGLPVDEIRRKFPKVYKQWQESPETICPPEGETVAEVLERVEKVLRKPLKKRAAFAVVVSEPLATLLSCALKGTRPELSVTNENRVEIIESNGQPVAVKLTTGCEIEREGIDQ